jgi:hypothetical protein
MIDLFVLLAPILLLPVVALLRFLGCTFSHGTAPTPTATTPTFHPLGGTFSGPKEVTLSAVDTTDATIFYTTSPPPANPPTPTASDHEYSVGVPIMVSTPATISAITLAPGHHPSEVATETYIIRPIVEVEVGGMNQRALANSASAVDSLNCAYPANVAAGSLLVALGGVDSNPASVTVTDTRLTPYTVLLSTAALTGGNKYFIAYGIAPSAGPNTVTVNPAGAASFISFAIDEFSGCHPTTPLDVDGGESTGTSTTPSDDLTTVSANALILGVVGHGEGVAPPTITPGGDYTQIGEIEDQTQFMAFNAVFRIVTLPQSYTVGWTLSTSEGWLAKTAAFKPEHPP